MTLDEFTLPDASSEVNTAKLSVLISRFLVCQCQNERNSSTQLVLFHTLQKWASNLPQNLRHFPDIDDPHSLQADIVGSVSI